MNGLKKHIEAEEIRVEKTRRAKKSCSRIFKSNLGLILLSFIIVGSFGACFFGLGMGLNFLLYIWKKENNFLTATISSLAFFPAVSGEIYFLYSLAKGKRVRLRSVFKGYTDLKATYIKLFGLIIYFSPWFIALSTLSAFASRTKALLPFVGEKHLYTAGIVFETAFIFLFFFLVSKGAFFLRIFALSFPLKKGMERTKKRFKKAKRDFEKYVLSHSPYFLLFIVIYYLPIPFRLPCIIFLTGRLTLSLASFSNGYKIKKCREV